MTSGRGLSTPLLARTSRSTSRCFEDAAPALDRTGPCDRERAPVRGLLAGHRRTAARLVRDPAKPRGADSVSGSSTRAGCPSSSAARGIPRPVDRRRAGRPVTALAPGGRLAVMARPAVGTVIRKPTSRGTSFALRVTFQGERVFVPLGGSWEGWTEDRVQAEREHIARMIARGEWTPPDNEPAAAAPGEPPSFQVFASEWLERKRRRVGAQDPQRPAVATEHGHGPLRPAPRRPDRRGRDRGLRAGDARRTRSDTRRRGRRPPADADGHAPRRANLRAPPAAAVERVDQQGDRGRSHGAQGRPSALSEARPAQPRRRTRRLLEGPAGREVVPRAAPHRRAARSGAPARRPRRCARLGQGRLHPRSRTRAPSSSHATSASPTS